jgi:hypothetical protein
MADLEGTGAMALNGTPRTVQVVEEEVGGQQILESLAVEPLAMVDYMVGVVEAVGIPAPGLAVKAAMAPKVSSSSPTRPLRISCQCWG